MSLADRERRLKKATKGAVACNFCRSKKVRCDGGQPCINCVDREEECVYQMMRRKALSSRDREAMEARISRMEAALKSANLPIPGPYVTTNSFQPGQEQDRDSTRSRRMPLSPILARMSESVHSMSDDDPGVVLRRENNVAITRQYSDAFQISSANDEHREGIVPRPRPDNSGHVKRRARASVEKGMDIIPPENSHWEYHGPRSFLSICSKSGIEWVSEETGVTDFSDIAMAFTRDVTRTLKLEKRIRPERTPEPDPETALRYCKVYFEETTESAFNIVLRPQFEARVRAYLEPGSTFTYDDDPAWYALRNIIYAFGCRTEISKASDHSTWMEAQTQGWRYFENALSRHTEMLYCKTGIMAVQALILMAFYVEGIACPSLEYVLCSSAMRLAQSQGLHRQADISWGMNVQEIQQRNQIFWMLYTYEKHISYRLGRASTIEDDDISCHIPTSVQLGGSYNLEFCVAAIRHAQISSQISKRLSTIQAYCQSPDDILKTTCELVQQLQEWRDSLPSYLRPGEPIKPSHIPKNLHIYHVIYVRYSYYGSLIAIHSPFTYPWSGIFGKGQALAIRNQVKASAEIVAEASRSIILATKHISVDPWSPVCLNFFFPIIGLINIFVHVLRYPALPTAQSDVALMEVVAGNFARLEVASSGQVAFSFARKISSIARSAIEKAQQQFISKNTAMPDFDQSNQRFIDAPSNPDASSFSLPLTFRLEMLIC